MGIEDNVTEVAKGTLEAYKSSPLLTGLLALNLVFLLGFGWFLVKKNEAHESLVARIIDEEAQFRDQLLQTALNCVAQKRSSGKAGYFPLPGND